MVSTRGVKARFVEGERVLCYEPDPSKAKVLYESKVLQVVPIKDGRGRKLVEYRIHFQGWNASWDRCVDEDLVLKDTEENRSLQRRLMEDAHTKLPVRLKEKKKKRRLSDTIREIVQENERHSKEKIGSETGSQAGTTDDDDGTSVTSDADSSAHGSRAPSSQGRGGGRRDSIALPVYAGPDTEAVVPIVDPCPAGSELYTREFPLEIPVALKAVLERDHQLIKEKHKLLRLPTPPAALTVLESYVVFFAARYLARTSERRRNETRLRDKAYLTLDLCKEVMDGVRVCFDFHCTSHLLYDEERQQAAMLASTQPPAPLLRDHNRTHPTENGKHEDKSKTTDDRIKGEDTAIGGSGGRRLTRSGGVRAGAADLGIPTNTGVSESGRSTPVTASSVCSSSSGLPPHPAALDVTGHAPSIDSTSSASQQSLLSSLGRQLSHDLAHWTLLPLTHRLPGTAILLYGPIHLLRLFVKLPEILYRMNLPVEKRKIILKHLQLFLEYLDMHNQQFFSESHYMASNTSSSI